jgi:hypothetical protein
MDEELTLETLLTFGREYLRCVERGPAAGRDIDLGNRKLLAEFLRAAIEAIEAQSRRQKRQRGGRPVGGMGSQVAALIDNGVAKDAAVRMIAEQIGKPEENVREAHRKHLSKTQKTPEVSSGGRKKPRKVSSGGREKP